ncbi:preprotein translocase subunit YajC [Helcococcus ovis]|uniref:preprotein translocase subunit YajC n=1 Tax=Helcococcus ovis TaxID=72026 RepID=UPI00106F6FFC|nr:preprotein translocase subunit YajC [Helcococcus ovis]TFF67944.1 preprotein translocase subunit YajC [Helcococcus ovis]WNZ01899.1 preprotein translocase subunit YajC [Helcococcus ovis]
MWEQIYASSIVFIVFILIIFAIIQIFNILNLKKSRQYYKKLHESIKPGVRIMLNNGIYGTLTRVGEKDVDIEIAKNVIITADRFSIREIKE